MRQREGHGENGEFPVEENDYPRRLDLSQKLHWSLFAVICKAMYEKYGDDALQTIHESIRDWPYWKELCEKCKVENPGNGTFKDFACPYNHVDRICFIMETKPEVISIDEKHARFHVTSCNVAQSIQKIFPRTCWVVSRAIEQGICSVINPRMKVLGDVFIGKGDPVCDITHVLEDDPEEQ